MESTEDLTVDTDSFPGLPVDGYEFSPSKSTKISVRSRATGTALKSLLWLVGYRRYFSRVINIFGEIDTKDATPVENRSVGVHDSLVNLLVSGSVPSRRSVSAVSPTSLPFATTEPTKLFELRTG